MKKGAALLILGLLVGVVATTYFFGAHRARNLPGTPIRPPDRNGDTSGTVAVTVEAGFSDQDADRAPTLRGGRAHALPCRNEIVT